MKRSSSSDDQLSAPLFGSGSARPGPLKWPGSIDRHSLFDSLAGHLLCEGLARDGLIGNDRGMTVDNSAGSGRTWSDQDRLDFMKGVHCRLYDLLGAHLLPDGDGVSFSVYAPAAREVSVIGPFNAWSKKANPLEPIGDSGIFQGVVRSARKGDHYKFHLRSGRGKILGDKADPLAFAAERAPETASIVWDHDFSWNDSEWKARRSATDLLHSPMSIYELHLGSWRRKDDGSRLTYRELADLLPPYVEDLGFTHVELMPVMEHPFYGSWGYQITGYFAPTSRYGTPQDFMALVDALHERGIGVILDFVPSHFPTDGHGLSFFDGTHLYEHPDMTKGFHPDWKSFIFNYGRPEVRSFLLSAALFWIERYHADGLRVDGVASMLYLDYSRKEGEWTPNRHGGRENLEAIAFIRSLNETIYRECPFAFTIAEESTSWPMVSHPTYLGGLGFGMKWDMGWMHDTLAYMQMDPLFRKFQHHSMTFRAMYASSENFVLALSHDEVVHGKGSLAERMPGDKKQKLANLRLLLGYQYALPGKKLLFMGAEFGQWHEWNHDDELDWDLLDDPAHAGIRAFLTDLNRLQREEPALHELDFEDEGFSWADCHDIEKSVLSLFRWDREGVAPLLAVFNFTPVIRRDYRLGVPRGSLRWVEILNSDAALYGGSDEGNLGGVASLDEARHGRPCSLALTLPGLSMLLLRPKTPLRVEAQKDGKARQDPEDQSA